MSTYIKHKLNDQSGMTILMALFAFLVAAMVAAVILAAAMSSMRQAKDNQQHQQDMLILQSAGELIERETLSTKVTIQDVTTYKDNGDVKDPTARTVSTNSDTLFADQVCDAARQLYPLASDTPVNDFVSGTSTITVTAGDFSQDVDVKFVFKKSATDDAKSEYLIFTLTTKGPDADSNHSLIVEFREPVTESSTVDEMNRKGVKTKSTTTKTLSWQTLTYKRVGGDE